MHDSDIYPLINLKVRNGLGNFWPPVNGWVNFVVVELMNIG